MKILLIWLCASAAMDSCEVHALSQPVTQQQCEALSDVYAEVLGQAENYLLICEDAQ